MLGTITGLLQFVAKAWGLRDGSVGGLWEAILAAATPLPIGAVVPVPAGAEGARFRLTRLLGQLNGSRELVVAIAEGRVPPPAISRHQMSADRSRSRRPGRAARRSRRAAALRARPTALGTRCRQHFCGFPSKSSPR
jgi:hypothetical protein